MKDIVESLLKLVPFIQSYPMWVRGIVAVWIILTSVVSLVLVFVKGGRKQWPNVGMTFIDEAHEQLNRLETQGRRMTDSDILEGLRPLFLDSAFGSIYLAPGEFLFLLCRTHSLLEHYVIKLSEPAIRSAFGKARAKVTDLKLQYATLYNPTFSLENHYQRYGKRAATFVESLPSRIRDVDAEFKLRAEGTLKEMRACLRPTGLIDWDG
jgi:hypothetical protein